MAQALRQESQEVSESGVVLYEWELKVSSGMRSRNSGGIVVNGIGIGIAGRERGGASGAPKCRKLLSSFNAVE